MRSRPRKILETQILRLAALAQDDRFVVSQMRSSLGYFSLPFQRATLNCAPANKISPEKYAQNSSPTET